MKKATETLCFLLLALLLPKTMKIAQLFLFSFAYPSFTENNEDSAAISVFFCLLFFFKRKVRGCKINSDNEVFYVPFRNA